MKKNYSLRIEKNKDFLENSEQRKKGENSVPPELFSPLYYKMPPLWKPKARGLGIGQRRKFNKSTKWQKRRPVGNKRIKNLKKSKMGRIALDASLALKTLKKHEPPVTDTQIWSTASGGDRVLVNLPYALDISALNSETQRECNNIYFFNSRGEFEIKPMKTTLDPYYIRFIMGWSKGNPDHAHPVSPGEGAHTTTLNSLLPTLEDKLDNDHYNVIVDREYTHSPGQIYQVSMVGISGVEHVTSNATWKPFKKKYNFKFNKKVMFDGGSGTDIIGDVPFVAMLIYTDKHDTAFTGPIPTTHPSPDVRMWEKSYFKDC